MSTTIPFGRFGKWQFSRVGDKAVALSVRFPPASSSDQTVVCKLDGEVVGMFAADKVAETYAWLKAKIDGLMSHGWTRSDRPLGLAVHIEKVRFLMKQPCRHSLRPIPSHTGIELAPVLF